MGRFQNSTRYVVLKCHRHWTKGRFLQKVAFKRVCFLKIQGSIFKIFQCAQSIPCIRPSAQSIPCIRSSLPRLIFIKEGGGCRLRPYLRKKFFYQNFCRKDPSRGNFVREIDCAHSQSEKTLLKPSYGKLYSESSSSLSLNTKICSS